MPDFTDFEGGDLIPEGTVAAVQFRIKYGDGTDGVLTRSQDGQSEMFKGEYTLLDGPFAKRKVSANYLMAGTTDGQKGMAGRNQALLKSIIDSAKNLDPHDKGPEARKARTMELRDFDGVRFQAEISVEAESVNKQTGRTYPAKNVIKKAITRDMPSWRGPIEQIPAEAGGQSPGSFPAVATPPNVTPIAKPAWAR
jgi:hypothetical protein